MAITTNVTLKNASLAKNTEAQLDNMVDSMFNIGDANTITGISKFSNGFLNTNVVEQSGTAAEDLTATASDLVWYSTAAQAGAITLPDATALNAGMKITVLVGTTNWSTTAFKLGFANAGSCVLVGQVLLSALDGDATDATAGFTITANAQSLEIDADAVTDAGGAIGSRYDFIYLEANVVHCMAYGMITTGTPAPSADASTTTGTS
jgi:hypothetical protein